MRSQRKRQLPSWDKLYLPDVMKIEHSLLVQLMNWKLRINKYCLKWLNLRVNCLVFQLILRRLWITRINWELKSWDISIKRMKKNFILWKLRNMKWKAKKDLLKSKFNLECTLSNKFGIYFIYTLTDQNLKKTCFDVLLTYFLTRPKSLLLTHGSQRWRRT